jgi:hypothetical protein
MAAAEEHAQELGIHCLHLFTNDKEPFYSHLGYRKGPVVSPLKKCTAKLDMQQVYYTDNTMCNSIRFSLLVSKHVGPYLSVTDVKKWQ